MFAYCGLVGNPNLTARNKNLAPLPTSTKLGPWALSATSPPSFFLFFSLRKQTNKGWNQLTRSFFPVPKGVASTEGGWSLLLLEIVGLSFCHRLQMRIWAPPFEQPIVFSFFVVVWS